MAWFSPPLQKAGEKGLFLSQVWHLFGFCSPSTESLKIALERGLNAASIPK
jgi:hypothetical protein